MDDFGGIMEKRYGGHGHDAKGDTFADYAAAVLYMLLEAARGGPYRRQSDYCATIAGPLVGKKVLDVGCGFGTTSVAIAQHAPGEIVALDSSPIMTRLFRSTLIEDPEQSEATLVAFNAEEVIGQKSTRRVLQLLGGMRKEFEASAFRQKGGSVQLVESSCMDELNSDLQGAFDVVMGNNFVHWPINALRTKLEATQVETEAAHHQAVVQVFQQLGTALKQGGILALMEPKNFVVIDEDPELDKLITARSSVMAHPVYVGVDAMMNEILAKEHGINRQPSRPAPLFKTSEVAGLFAEAGFTATKWHLRENIEHGRTPQDMIEAVFAASPMHLAGVNIPMEEKIAIAHRLRRMAQEQLPASAFEQPMREVSFVFSATKL